MSKNKEGKLSHEALDLVESHGFHPSTYNPLGKSQPPTEPTIPHENLFRHRNETCEHFVPTPDQEQVKHCLAPGCKNMLIFSQPNLRCATHDLEMVSQPTSEPRPDMYTDKIIVSDCAGVDFLVQRGALEPYKPASSQDGNDD